MRLKMGSLVCFNLTDNIVYCPIHLNNDVLIHNYGGNKDIAVREDVMIRIIRNLKDEINYILDFSRCDGSVESTPELLKMLKESKVLIITEEKFKEAFNIQKDKLDIKIENWWNGKSDFWKVEFNNNIELNDYIDNLENPIGELEPSDYFVKFILTKFFLRDIKKNSRYDFSNKDKKYLSSSNVYVNKYINVKSLFLDYDYMMMVISELAQIIYKHFKKYHGQISLLGVSNNGIILANILSYELKAPAYSLNRLGPVYCLEEDVDRLVDFSDKNYILVSDVTCMGGEYRMAKGIVDILGSRILGGISVVKIRDVYRNDTGTDVFAIIDDINQFKVEGEIIDYQVYIDNEIRELEE